MSTKGIKHSAITKYKISLANKKNRTELHNKISEYLSGLKKNSFPSITSASIHADISEQALLNYEARTEENSEVRVLLDKIRAKQKEYLMVTGLNKKSNSTIVKLLLSAHHNIQETPNSLTQNNIYNNLSPELLDEVIKASRNK